MARKSTPKVNDVFLTIDKNDVAVPANQHPTLSSKAKDKIQRQNEKAAEEVASSQQSTTFIAIESPDFNSTGDDFQNSEGIYVKRIDPSSNEISESSYNNIIEEQQKIKNSIENKFNYEITTDSDGNIIKTKIDNNPTQIPTSLPDKTYISNDNSIIRIVSSGNRIQAVASRPDGSIIKTELSGDKTEKQLINEILTILSITDGVETDYTIARSYKENIETDPNVKDIRPVKQSPFGPFVDTSYNLTTDINSISFENLKGDTKVEIYNGMGKKLGFRPLVSRNKFNKPIVQDFYAAIARLDAAASIDRISIRIIRAYQSFQEQIEIRRKYAPENKKSDDRWLNTTEPSAGFKNESGDSIKVNKPGYGYHIFGNTFDIYVNDMKIYEWMVKNAHNYGFYRTIPGEIWHWEYKPWLYRLGGRENPTKPAITNVIGGWKNDLWQILYTKLTDTLDPTGPKFLPNNHPSWMGFKGEIKGDIVNDIPPFISTTSTGKTLNFADLVAETPQSQGVGIPDNERRLIGRLRQIFKDKGFKWFDGILQLNIVGVRSKGNKSGSNVSRYGEFNDFLYCIFKDKNNQIIIKKYNITTEPGKEVLSSKNAAILVPGQYPIYKLGFHGSKRPYLAFWQLTGKVKVARDSNLDEVYDYNAPVQSGFFGINIHKSGIGITQKIQNWSEGCQVFSSSKQWEEFIEITKRSAEYQGESYSRIIQAENEPPEQILTNRTQPNYQFGNFTYTLIKEEDF